MATIPTPIAPQSASPSITRQFAGKARDAASAVSHKAEDATYAVGSCMQSFAGKMRDSLPREGLLGTTASSLANTLERGGRFLQQEGLSRMAQGATNLIRRSPLPAMLVGFGLGYMLARLTARS
jgi:hypothetical protein